MNIIFDIGNVLVDYNPLQFLKELLNDDEAAEMMLEKSF